MLRIGRAQIPKVAGRAGLLLAITIGARAADKITWKPITDAVLRIDDRAPKQWSLYHAGKKFDPLLLQLGTRVLVIYVRNRMLYEIPSAQIRSEERRVGKECRSRWSPYH